MERSATKIRWYQRPIPLLTVVFIILLTGCNSSQDTKVAVTWSSQLAAVQQLANQVDPDAVLQSVLAGPETDLQEDAFHSLGIRFYFARPTGEIFTIFLEDTDIQSTLKILDDGHRSDTPLTHAERERLRKALATVHISAADALRLTRMEGQRFTQQADEKINPIIGLHMDTVQIDVPKKFGLSAAWSVLYIAEDRELRIWIDAQTGNIVSREEIK
jgi:hypothetical protein